MSCPGEKALATTYLRLRLFVPTSLPPTSLTSSRRLLRLGVGRTSRTVPCISANVTSSTVLLGGAFAAAFFIGSGSRLSRSDSGYPPFPGAPSLDGDKGSGGPLISSSGEALRPLEVSSGSHVPWGFVLYGANAAVGVGR